MATQRTLGQQLRGDLGFIPVLLTLIVIMAFFEITTNGLFLSPRNLSFLILQNSEIALLSLGVTLVLLLGEIDLSLASVAVLSAVVMGVLSTRVGFPGWAAILVGLLVGAVAGAINGFFIAILRIPSFIVTLAASIAYAGLLLYLLNGQATLILNDPLIIGLSGSPYSYLPNWGIALPIIAVALYIGSLLYEQARRRRTGLRLISPASLYTRIIVSAVLVIGAVILFQSYQGIPYSTALLFGLIILFWLILRRTTFGRHVYAVGGNPEASRRAGINVTYIRIMVFTLCSLLAAVGGIIEASRGNAVASQIDTTLLLNAIAAAVIGGVSLFGGKGSVWNIVLGVLIIGSLVNGLALRSQGSDVQQMIEGAVLIIAVTVDALIRRAQARTGR
ncbi:MAG TPA: inner-membrane translocator [Ktedonobacter sp.]|nr:inner-membrane translocator [Ktedonobacter sp.]